ENPEQRSHGIASAVLDGTPVDARAIPLIIDGREHEVRVALGSRLQEPMTASGIAELPGL
ncbi:MAG: hypothetical protein M3478_01275, partial [Planctomycetota bacterium]|nr:hypothetical protein [Planctomycetota bacterium]